MTQQPANCLKSILTGLFIVLFLFISSSAHSQVKQLWGLTSGGGATNGGVLFSYQLSNNIFKDRKDLATAIGSNPFGSCLLFNNKIYGTTRTGGAYNANTSSGVLFEYDPERATYTKKIDLGTNVFDSGSSPAGSLVAFNNKLYGMTTLGGPLFNYGTIFEWDPATNIYAFKKGFTNTSGAVIGKYPYGSLVLYSGTNKLYGMTKNGGANGVGVIFSYDPATNTYSKLYDFVTATGSSPQGSLIVYNNLLYGLTQAGGAGGAGVIFQFDPVGLTYTKKIDLSTVNGLSPYGDMVVYNNIMYGVTTAGGLTSDGIIFSYDPSTNTCIRKVDLSAATGGTPNGSLSVFNNKLYGMTNLGGTSGFGVIFEWDPVSNIYTKKVDFTGTANGANPERTALIVVPAPVAFGTANSCEVAPTITIDNTNFNSWVPVLDSKGDVIAEIKGNGNSMGTITTSFYTQNSPHREDIHHKLYLGRNISFTPQTQPTTKDSIRIYLKKYEVDSLILALNSFGQPTGIAGIHELGIFKNNEPCQAVGVINAKHVTQHTDTTYGVDYYLQFADTTLSTYYFANDTFQYILPIQMEYFKGVHNRFSNTLRWKATCSRNINFDIERSADAIHFEKLGNVVADTSNCGSEFLFTDQNPLAETNYYRIRINEDHSLVKYSDIIQLQGGHTELTISIVPTMVDDGTANLHVNAAQGGTLGLVVTDLQGRTVLKQQINVSAGSSATRLNVQHLASGIYHVYGVINNVSTQVQRFVKK